MSATNTTIDQVLANKNVREFRQERKSERTKTWFIVQEKDYYHVVWGLEDCKLQITHDRPGECGLKDSKAYRTPEQQCALVIERMVKKKLEEGYREFEKGKFLTKEVSTFEWGKALPKNLCFFKPKNSIEDDKLDKLNNKGKLLATRKRDGMMHVIVRDDSYKGITIYSRRMDEATESFPHLVELLQDNDELLPDKTMLLGEMIYNLHKDDGLNFRDVSRVCRSLPEEAIKRQKEELGWIKYYTFDVAFWAGQFVLTEWTYGERYTKILHEKFGNFAFDKDPHIVPIHNIGLKFTNKKGVIDFDALMEFVIESKWEGLVLFQHDKKFEAKYAMTFDGKAKRPNAVWKKKPIFEDDFIVRFDPDKGIGKYGKGKNAGRFGAGQLHQINSKGEEVYIGECGGGLDDDQRKRYAKKSLFPRVWCVEYAGRTESGSLRFPVFNADRTDIGDKDIEECLMPE